MLLLLQSPNNCGRKHQNQILYTQISFFLFIFFFSCIRNPFPTFLYLSHAQPIRPYGLQVPPLHKEEDALHTHLRFFNKMKWYMLSSINMNEIILNHHLMATKCLETLKWNDFITSGCQTQLLLDMVKVFHLTFNQNQKS